MTSRLDLKTRLPGVAILLVFLMAAQFAIVNYEDSFTAYYHYLIVVGAFFFLVALLRWSQTILYLAALLFPFQSLMIVEKWSIKWGAMVNFWMIDAVALTAGLIALLALRGFKSKSPETTVPYNVAIFALVAYSFLSLFWTINLRLSEYALIKLLVCAAFFYAPLVLIKTKRQVVIIIVLLFLSGIPMAIGGILSTKIGTGTIHDTLLYTLELTQRFDLKFLFLAPQHKRATGFAYPNFLSIFLAISFISGTYLFTRARQWLFQVLIACVLVLFIYAQIHTLSKGGLVAFAGGAYAFIVFNPRLRSRWLRNSIILTAVVIGVFLVFSNLELNGGVARLGSGLSSSKLASSSGSRKFIWKMGFRRFIGTYGAGLGVGSMVPATKLHLHTHNAFMGVIFELGAVGLFFYCFLYYILYRQTRRLRMLASGTYADVFSVFLAMLVLWSLHSLIEFDYYLLRVPWFIFGLAVTVINLRIRDEGVEHELEAARPCVPSLRNPTADVS